MRGLGGGVAGALEDGLKRQAGPLGEELREKRGLIETPLAFARGMERDRDHDIEAATL